MSTSSLRAQTSGTPDLSPVAAPPDPGQLRPVERVPRNEFGVAGAFPWWWRLPGAKNRQYW
jgi:hypothetical protein